MLIGSKWLRKNDTIKSHRRITAYYTRKIYLNGQDLTPVPVEQRNIGFIFQDYALFPHLTVKENIQFGLDKKSAMEKSKFRKICLT